MVQTTVQWQKAIRIFKTAIFHKKSSEDNKPQAAKFQFNIALQSNCESEYFDKNT